MMSRFIVLSQSMINGIKLAAFPVIFFTVRQALDGFVFIQIGNCGESDKFACMLPDAFIHDELGQVLAMQVLASAS